MAVYNLWGRKALCLDCTLGGDALNLIELSLYRVLGALKHWVHSGFWLFSWLVGFG